MVLCPTVNQSTSERPGKAAQNMAVRSLRDTAHEKHYSHRGRSQMSSSDINCQLKWFSFHCREKTRENESPLRCVIYENQFPDL